MKRLLLAASFAFIAAAAYAQPGPQSGAQPKAPWPAPGTVKPQPLTPPAGQLSAVGGEPDRRLALAWFEREGDWTGEWIPVDASHNGAFNASWRRSNSRERPAAHLQIEISGERSHGERVAVHRTSAQGTCTYAGHFTTGIDVSGTYHCSWAPGQVLPWSAHIGP